MRTEEWMGNLIRDARTPVSPGAYERALHAARQAAGHRSSSRHTWHSRPVLAAGAVAMLVALSFTPPGRAVADELADLVGIGGPSTVDHGAPDAPITARAGAIALDRGTTPDGIPFEIIAFDGTRPQQEQLRLEQLGQAAGSPGVDESAVGSAFGTCFAIDWPEAASPYGDSACAVDGTSSAPLGTPVLNEAHGQAGPGTALLMEGVTGPDVSRVSAQYVPPGGEPSELPVGFGKLNAELADQVGAHAEIGFYTAFLPTGLVGSDGFSAPALRDIDVVAYDASGAEVARVDYGSVYDRVKAQGERSRRMEQELQRLSQLPDREVRQAEDPLGDAAAGSN